MSWIISRERAGEYQQLKHTSEWESMCDFGTIGLPLQYVKEKDALWRMRIWEEKDPDWDYQVNYYE